MLFDVIHTLSKGDVISHQIKWSVFPGDCGTKVITRWSVRSGIIPKRMSKKDRHALRETFAKEFDDLYGLNLQAADHSYIRTESRKVLLPLSSLKGVGDQEMKLIKSLGFKKIRNVDALILTAISPLMAQGVNDEH